MLVDWSLQSTIFNDITDVPFYNTLMNCITCSSEYTLKQTENDGKNMLSIIYTPTADQESSLFHWAIKIPLNNLVELESYDLQLFIKLKDNFTCLYQAAIYQYEKKDWKVIQRVGNLEINDDNTNCVTFSNILNLDSSPLYIGFTRIDFEVAEISHSLELFKLTVHTPKQNNKSDTREEDISTNLIISSLKSKKDTLEPISVILKETLTDCSWWRDVTDDTTILLKIELQGTCDICVSSLKLLFRISDKEYVPIVCPVFLDIPSESDVQLFSITTNPIFLNIIRINKISIYLHPELKYNNQNCNIYIKSFECTPIITDKTTFSYPTNSIDHISDDTLISKLNQNVEQLQYKFQDIQKVPGPQGTQGKRGSKGDRGEAMRFLDLTAEQKTELRGLRGATGLRGEALTFKDLTFEQKHEIKGEKGDKGLQGLKGEKGETGEKGDAFRFEHFTSGQFESLKGPTGLTGERGLALTFEQLKQAEKESLRGEKGLQGEKGTKGDRGEMGRIGMTGPRGPDGKTGPRGLPGIPGAKGDSGDRGNAGIDGKNGNCAKIYETFASIDLLVEFIHKSASIDVNSYYIIENDESEEHGSLFVYRGKYNVDIVIACTYIDNLKSIFKKYNATIRAKVLQNENEWKLSLEVDGHNEDGKDDGVYQLFNNLQGSIRQNGYEVLAVDVIEESYTKIGKLCGQRGYTGKSGPQGDAGKSLMGLQLDYIGDEIMRLKLKPENRTLFLQLTESKTSEPGFYLYDSHTNRWALLQGVNIEDEFMKWMIRFVDDPHHDSIPIALSMFSTAQKRMDTQYNTLIHDLSEYKLVNDKWKTYQYENWKAVGSTQYQNLSTQLEESFQKIENTNLQVSNIYDKCVIKEELSQLRKVYDSQYTKLETTFREVRDKISTSSDKQIIEKHTFDSEHDKIHSKIRDIDLSIIKILKVISFMKNSPWIKPIRLIRQDVDKICVEQDTKRCKFEKDITEKIDTIILEGRETNEVLNVANTKHIVLADLVNTNIEEVTKLSSKHKKQTQKLDYLLDKDFPESITRQKDENERLRSHIQEQIQIQHSLHLESIETGLKSCNQYTDKLSDTLKLQHSDILANTNRIATSESTLQQRIVDVTSRLEKQNETNIVAISNAKTHAYAADDKIVEKVLQQGNDTNKRFELLEISIDKQTKINQNQNIDQYNLLRTETKKNHETLQTELVTQQQMSLKITPQLEAKLNIQNQKYTSHLSKIKEDITSLSEKQKQDIHSQEGRITDSTVQFERLLQTQQQDLNESILNLNVDTNTKIDKLKLELKASDAKQNEILPKTDKALQTHITDITDKLSRIQYENTVNSDKFKKEVSNLQTKENYLIRQEMLDADNDIKQSVCQHSQDIKSMQRSIEKQVQDIEFYTTNVCKKNISQCNAYATELCTDVRTKCDINESRHVTNEKKHQDFTNEVHAFIDRTKSQFLSYEEEFSNKLNHKTDKLSQDMDKKLVKTAEVMQSELVAQEKLVSEQFIDINKFAAEIKSDLHTTDDKWSQNMDAHNIKITNETAHLLDRLKMELTQLIKTSDIKNDEHESELKKQLKLQSDQYAYENKQISQRIADSEIKSASNLDNRITTTVTNFDGKIREFDQRYANTVQGLTNDVQNIDSKCSTVDYLLKARLTSIEEHVQQLFSDGQQLCENTVSKNKTEIIQTFEKMRDDVMQYQKKSCQNMSNQITKSDDLSNERQHKTKDELAEMQKILQSMTKRAVEYENRLLLKHQENINYIEDTRKEWRMAMEMQRGLINTNKQSNDDALLKNIREITHKFEKQINEKCTTLDTKNKETELKWMSQMHLVNSKVDELKHSITTKMNTITNNIKEIATHQTDYRLIHDTRMQSIISLTHKMFSELIDENK